MGEDLIGIVGKPNAGKSTFFRAATLAEAASANYPFTTVDPNRGVAYVRENCPCVELGVDCDPRNSPCRDGTRFVPVQLLDVAGLVPGAYEGKGLGNQFLDQLRRASGLIHVVDACGGTDAEGNPVEPGTRDPELDVDFLVEEMELWLLGILNKNWNSMRRRVESGGSDLVEEVIEVFSGLGVERSDVTASVSAVGGPRDSWTREEKLGLVTEIRKRSKPVMVAANKVDVAEDRLVEELMENFDAQPVSSEGELALRLAAEEGIVDYTPGDASFEVTGEPSEGQREALERVREAVLEKYGSTGVQPSIERTVRDLMDKIVVYPVSDRSSLTDGEGNVLPDALLVDSGSTPRDVAYELHGDIGDSFHHAVDARTGRRMGESRELENGAVISIVTA